MIEIARPYIEKLLQQEPWRAEVSANKEEPCEGDVNWDGSKHWHCRLCGRISKMTFLYHSPPPKMLALRYVTLIQPHA